MEGSHTRIAGQASQTPKRVTLADVAAASGVSLATVSFVLNDKPGKRISAETRARVIQAASELGYVPSGLARAMREGVSRIVLLAIPPESDSGYYVQSYIRGLEEELRANDHILLVHHGPSTEDMYAELRSAVAPRAVIALGEWYFDGHEFDDGGWDSGLAANTARQLEHLVDRGHTHIAMATSGRTNRIRLSDLRLKWAREAAQRMGLPHVQRFRVPLTLPEAAASLERFRSAHPAITAMATVDDETANYLLRAAVEIGIVVPDELAVIGFDGVNGSGFTLPPLTTLRIDGAAHGRIAARRILGLAPNADVTKPLGVLVLREST